MQGQKIVEKIEKFIFAHRGLLVTVFFILTAGMLYSAIKARVDVSFTKKLPLQHEYIQTFLEYREQFGGANRIVIALMVEEGDIFTPKFFEILKSVTDEIFFLPGVDRAQVTSLFTPNVRFVEIVEDGFSGGNVVPDDFEPTAEGLKKVRENVIKSGRVGRLVANDFSGAIISAQLQEVNPATGEKLDYIKVANHLEENIRQRFEKEGEDIGLNIHIIGFTKIIGDIAEGARSVIFFFIISFLITGFFVYCFSLSHRLTALSMACALIAVIWQIGLLTILGYGIDPMSILVPFLIFAIGISHGVQMVRCFREEIFLGRDNLEAARSSFRQLFIPGATALLTDTIGFVTILLIKIEVIQELAKSASLGVATVFFTTLVLLPILLSYIRLKPGYLQKVKKRQGLLQHLSRKLARISEPRISLVVIVIAIGLFVAGYRRASEIKIGDLNAGVPELRETSRYNTDSATITENFTIGVDLLSVIVETVPDGCIDFNIMSNMDRFEWHMRNVQGVQSVIGLAGLAKVINAGWNEGSPKWQILPRHPAVLAQSISPVDTSSGLLNANCDVMPILIFLEDHKAETIETVIAAIKTYAAGNNSENPKITFNLASGNVGVMGATNEVVSAAQFPILLYVFTAVIILCLLAFRSWKAAFCIVVPLALVSVLAYALMQFLGIGLKVSTLPVVALGVGVGVDYGIYLFSRLQILLRTGAYFEDALARAYELTGSAVVFTGLTLAVCVSTWIFSELKFQADMGILLTFMFFFNMLGAMLLLPAIARWLFKHHRLTGEAD